jgi:hypothetical protein
MKKILFVLVISIAAFFSACTKNDFSDSYADPSKISSTTVSKQFAGFVKSNSEYVLPSYYNYFVILRITLNRYNQAVGWENGSNQYVPGASAVNDRWKNYYNFLAQYREFQKVYSQLSEEEQAANRIYMIAATIYFYDHSQKVVDLHGNIPWSEAGMLSTNGGDYSTSYAGYDSAEDVYTTMLDGLKSFADELNSISVESSIQTVFKNQDLINGGDLTLWKKYCNSLRLRMLTRVSGVSAFESRANSEIAEILSNSATYPIVSSNSDNIQIEVFDVNSAINSTGFQTGLEDWNGNIAGKAMIDHMNTNGDPRLRAIYQPGDSADGVYIGLDPLLLSSQQSTLIAGGTMAIYNRSTVSRNDYFPGELINAAEVSFLLSEYYLKSGNDASAKTAYENGIKQSVDYYYWLRSLSNDNSSGDIVPTNDTEIGNYMNSEEVSWNNATTDNEKLNLIATQKWIHFNVIEPVESWAEIRRLDLPQFNFWEDDANAQKQPPYRWTIPSSEQTYNTANYEAVKASDNLTTKIFWDVE